MKKGKFKEVATELIDEPETSVRLKISDRDIYELSESIKEVGQLQEVLVVAREDRFEIVAGHRRLLACRLIKKEKMRCHIVDMTKEEIAVAKATENLQKEGLSSVEEAGIYVDLYDNNGMTVNQIATKMGRSATHVKKFMDILRMDELVIRAVHEGKISIAVAEQLERIDEKKEKLRYLDIAVENGATAPTVKMWVEDIRKSLQYLDNRDELPPPEIDYVIPAKTYAACEMCDNPVEYRNIRIFKLCPGCWKELVESISKSREQGKG